MVEGDKYDYTKPSVLQERDGLIGTVKFFDQSRSFGFVTLSPVDGGGDVFLHLKEVAGGKVLSIPVTRDVSKSENEFRRSTREPSYKLAWTATRGCIFDFKPKP
jgi:cold shock CspA family protein